MKANGNREIPPTKDLADNAENKGYWFVPDVTTLGSLVAHRRPQQLNGARGWHELCEHYLIDKNLHISRQRALFVDISDDF